jgi:hypothetical protein
MKQKYQGELLGMSVYISQKYKKMRLHPIVWDWIQQFVIRPDGTFPPIKTRKRKTK